MPVHVQARWRQLSETYVVKDLFGTNAATNAALREVKLHNLHDLVGETEYTTVSVKKSATPTRRR